MSKKIIIIGGGVGGLACAVDLLSKGYEVVLFEKEDTLGGKVNILKHDDFRFDLTASILMTPKSYTDIFKNAGVNYRDYFHMKMLEPMYQVFYSDGSSHEFYSNDKYMHNSLYEIDNGLYIEYKKFIDNTLKKYFSMKNKFLDVPMNNIIDFITFDKVLKGIELRPLLSCDRYISSFISEKKIRDYLLFQCMYIGINPYKSSNLYCTIPTISSKFGLWYIEGGMYKYIEALEKLILDLGGEIHKNTEVSQVLVRDNTVKGVKVNKYDVRGDAVVVNADFPYAIKNLFIDEIRERRYNKNSIDDLDYSYGVIIIYLKLDTVYECLKVNNLVISSNLEEELNMLDKGKLPSDMSMYVYYPSAIDSSLCKEGSVMNIMVRVPSLDKMKKTGEFFDKEEIKKFRDKIVNKIKKKDVFKDIENHIEYEEILTPKELQQKFNSYNGSSFGIAHTIMQSLYFRPPMKSENIKNLYYVGSSVHPGNGISIILDGTKVLCNVIDNEMKEG